MSLSLDTPFFNSSVVLVKRVGKDEIWELGESQPAAGNPVPVFSCARVPVLDPLPLLCLSWLPPLLSSLLIFRF